MDMETTQNEEDEVVERGIEVERGGRMDACGRK